MQTVRMVSQAEHVYAGRRHRAGEEFDCEAQHVQAWINLGWARVVVPPQESAAPQEYLTRHMLAATPRGVRRSRK